MPTREFSVINMQGAPFQPGFSVVPDTHYQQVCADLPGGAPSVVLAAAINNTLGRGRLRIITAAMGAAVTLRLTCMVDGSPQIVRIPLAANTTLIGPDDSRGLPFYLTRINKIETVNNAGAPMAPGDVVKIDWVRPGGRLAADKSATVIGIYPGDAAAAAPINQWMRVQDRGPGQAKCLGGWAALDQLVVGTGGALRKKAATGDDAARVVGVAVEASADGDIGPINLG